MRTVRVELQKPIYNGGNPHIGIADFRLKGADLVEAEIMYVRKSDGRRSYPEKFVMSVTKLMTYPTQIVGSGVKLFVAPLGDWDVI